MLKRLRKVNKFKSMSLERSNSGFSLVELVVTIAIIGILVMLGTPRFMGYIERAELAKIQHDVKIMEDKMAEKMINSNKEYLSWDNNVKDLGILILANRLYETEGLAKSIAKPKNIRYGDVASNKSVFSLLNDEPDTHKEYKVIPKSMTKEIKSSLSGTFYSNIDGKVYYEHGKHLKEAKKDIILGCEAPKPDEYTFDHLTGTIVKYHGNLQHLVIPGAFEVDGKCYPVLIIGRGAFMRGNYEGPGEEKPIKTVRIPPSVEKIEKDAFKDNEIESVIIPPGVTNIEGGAFGDNNFGGKVGASGSGVIIQGGSSSGGGIDIGSGAFSSSGGSVSPIYRPSTDKDLNISVNTTTNDEGRKIGVITEYKGSDTSVVIPAIIIVSGEEVTIEEIDKGAFQGKGLITVKFPDGLKRIENYAFAGNQLIGAIIPTSVEHIGDYAFGFNEVSVNKKPKSTIRNINIFSKERLEKLDKNGNISDDGIKVDKLKEEGKIVNLLDYIFITSKSNVAVYVGDSDSSDDDNNHITEEEIQVLINQGYIPISNSAELSNVRNDLSGKYIQVADIDMLDINNFEPIGNYENNNINNSFRGTYNGGNFKISNLTINRLNKDCIGLFGSTQGATIENVGLLNIDIRGKDYTGGLVGLAGNSSTITNSYSMGEVKGTGNDTGGLVGNNSISRIINSYSIVKTGGRSFTGGLVGSNGNSIITNSYSSGEVNGTGQFTGGLVGENNGRSTVTNSYSKGEVKGWMDVGGLVGRNTNLSRIRSSYYDKEASGQSSSTGGIGLITTQMKQQESYANWDFDTVWQINPGEYPTLRK